MMRKTPCATMWHLAICSTLIAAAGTSITACEKKETLQLSPHYTVVASYSDRRGPAPGSLYGSFEFFYVPDPKHPRKKVYLGPCGGDRAGCFGIAKDGNALVYWNYSEKVKQKGVWIHTHTRGDELQYRHGDVNLIYGNEPTDTNAMRVKYYGLSPSRGGVPCGHYFVPSAYIDLWSLPSRSVEGSNSRSFA